jgi:hypothetical protein
MNNVIGQETMLEAAFAKDVLFNSIFLEKKMLPCLKDASAIQCQR